MGEAVTNPRQQERLLKAAQPLVRTAQEIGLVDRFCTITINVAEGEPVKITGETGWASARTKGENGKPIGTMTGGTNAEG